MSAAPDFVLRGSQVLTPGGLGPATVHIRGGTVERIAAHDDVPTGAPVEDAGEALVLPGLVDTHVHVNEPGRTHWEGFETATRAAAAGGVTTFVDMPLNCVPATTTLAALREKQEAAAPHLHVNVTTWGGVVPGNVDELGPMAAAGVPGFKCFLVPSGVDEFPHVTEADLRLALPRLAELGVPLLVHAELPGPIDAAANDLDCDHRAYGCYLSSRPGEAERQAVELLVRLCRETGARVHVVHLACGDAVPLLRDAQAEGLPISAETCPHYLTLEADAVPDGATAFKCAPPIRERPHAEALWSALEDGVLHTIVTDHSPCPPDLKRCDTGDFMEAWGGISSLQLGLPAVWTEARRRGLPIERVLGWMATATARFAGLGHRKGRIAPGYDADLILFDPDATQQVRGAALEHRHKVTPYEGRTLAGRVLSTYLRGARVFHDGQVTEGRRGQFLRIQP